MTQQQKSTIWFAVITLLLAVSSIFTSNSLSNSDLSDITKAIEEVTEVVIFQQNTNTSSSSQQAKVVRVIDGDTIVLESGEKVRYIGIDAPEIHHPQQGVECFGTQAFERNKALVEGKIVNLEKDVSETDKYGRLLRYVWLENTLINESLILEGYAVASSYPPDIKNQHALDQAERIARENNQGLWSSCSANN